MTDTEIEERLTDDVKAETPDILDSLMEEIPRKKKAPGISTVIRGTSTAISIYKILAAVIALFIGAGAIASQQNKTFAVIGIDVNPSIEISINRKERVVSARALNDEGEKVLDGMDLKGSHINTACNALIGVMALDGYLTEDSNSMLLSVQSRDAEKGKELEEDIAEKLSDFFENSKIAAAVMGQYVENDERVREFADENDISTGKAWLILRLLETGSKHFTRESLLELSTQELILLGQERNALSDDQHGKVSKSKYIDEGKAVETALENAGAKHNDASGLTCEFDCDNGVIIYEIEFMYGGLEYEYEIDAVTGKIISAEEENEGSSLNGAGRSSSGNAGASVDDDRDDDHDDDDHDKDDDDDRYEDDDDDKDEDDDDNDD
ncbi:MAG: PepSY domain-containing protein [Eubacterium sp.]|nr:PepSY domain-containing protein [Eubacterium sp.]